MRMNRGRDNTPSVKPVQKIELSEKGVKKRAILAVALLAFGLVFLGVAIFNWLSYDEGWTRIEPTTQSGESVAGDMLLLYELGVSDMSATAEYKAVSVLYTDLCAKAYRIFHADYGFEDVHNPYYINRNIGQEIEVEPALYRAFKQIDRAQSRFLFAAPFYTEYKNIFSDTEDFSAAQLDPYKNEDIAKYFAQLSAYTSSEEHVRLELLGDNRVKLHVSDEFQNFARENAIDTFIDFFWAKNAFIVDYIAESLVEAGYLYGSISAYDGFMRTFDTRENSSYSYNLISRYDSNFYDAGKLECKGQNSIVFLRSFKMNERDLIYYRYEDGAERHPYVDVNDGLCKNSLDTLVSYSYDLGCGEVLLSVMPIYVEEAVDYERLASLAQDGVYSIYCDGTALCYNEEAIILKNLYDDGKTKFTAKFVK